MNKKLKVILSVLGVSMTAIVATSEIMTKDSQKDIESYPYTVLKSHPTFEIRSYPSRNFSSITVENNQFEKTSKKAFPILAGYIFGGNETKEEIAMTTPVSMIKNDSTTMMFMIPNAYSLADLPQPNNKNIKIITLPERKMAAIRFSGWANESKIKRYQDSLRSLLDANQYTAKGEFVYMGYNPPWEITNRRNEVLIEVE